MLTDNGPALLAELRAYEAPGADRAALAAIVQPVLLVAAADSPPEFHEPIEALAGALPNARPSWSRAATSSTRVPRGGGLHRGGRRRRLTGEPPRPRR